MDGPTLSGVKGQPLLSAISCGTPNGLCLIRKSGNGLKEVHIFDVKEVDALAEARIQEDDAQLLTVDIVGTRVERFQEVPAKVDANGALIERSGGKHGKGVGALGRDHLECLAALAILERVGVRPAGSEKAASNDLGPVGALEIGIDKVLEVCAVLLEVLGVQGADGIEQLFKLGRSDGHILQDAAGIKVGIVKLVCAVDGPGPVPALTQAFRNIHF